MTRIAMWSGPRNISTAMMRSFGSRPDTAVTDEPLYAHYLKVTGVAHPGRDDVLAAHESDWRKVADQLTGPVPGGRAIWYQKHMAHHLLPMIERAWLDQSHARIPDSRAGRDGRLSPENLSRRGPRGHRACRSNARYSIASQAGMAAHHPSCSRATYSSDPRAQLEALCDALGIQFLPGMLAWAAGPRDTDGAWAPHWYAAVEASTGFEPYRRRQVDLNAAQERLVDECRPWYEKLYALRLRA